MIYSRYINGNSKESYPKQIKLEKGGELRIVKTLLTRIRNFSFEMASSDRPDCNYTPNIIEMFTAGFQDVTEKQTKEGLK